MYRIDRLLNQIMTILAVILQLFFIGCSENEKVRDGWRRVESKDFTIDFPQEWKVESFSSIEGDPVLEVYSEGAPVAYVEFSPYAPYIKPRKSNSAEVHGSKGWIHTDEFDPLTVLNKVFEEEIGGKKCRISMPMYRSTGYVGAEFNDCGMSKYGMMNRFYIGMDSLPFENQGPLLDAIASIRFK